MAPIGSYPYSSEYLASQRFGTGVRPADDPLRLRDGSDPIGESWRRYEVDYSNIDLFDPHRISGIDAFPKVGELAHEHLPIHNSHIGEGLAGMGDYKDDMRGLGIETTLGRAYNARDARPDDKDIYDITSRRARANMAAKAAQQSMTPPSTAPIDPVATPVKASEEAKATVGTPQQAAQAAASGGSGNFFGNLTNSATGLVKTGLGAAGNIVNTATGAAGSLVNTATGAAGSLVNTATGAAGSLVNTATGAAGSLVNTATGAVGSLANTATGAAGSLANTATGAAGSLVNTATGAVGSLANTATGAATGVVNTATSTVKSVTSGFGLFGGSKKQATPAAGATAGQAAPQQQASGGGLGGILSGVLGGGKSGGGLGGILSGILGGGSNGGGLGGILSGVLGGGKSGGGIGGILSGILGGGQKQAPQAAGQTAQAPGQAQAPAGQAAPGATSGTTPEQTQKTEAIQAYFKANPQATEVPPEILSGKPAAGAGQAAPAGQASSSAGAVQAAPAPAKQAPPLPNDIQQLMSKAVKEKRSENPDNGNSTTIGLNNQGNKVYNKVEGENGYITITDYTKGIDPEKQYRYLDPHGIEISQHEFYKRT